MPNIRLNRGLVAIVDEEDVELIERFNWNGIRGRQTWYAGTVTDNFHLIVMHRYVMGFPKGKVVDHINGNGLDNRRCNLRIATRSQNAANVGKREIDTLSSRYKGVHYEKYGTRRRRWRAGIRMNGRHVRLGSFLTEHEAAKAYDRAAQEHFGEFARLNFDN